MKVLVVEDDDLLRRMWKEALGQAGHMVQDAADAAAARHILMTEGCDAVLLDLNLGSDSGLSVATLATYRNPDCKVIMITGSSLFPKGELFDVAPAVAAVLRKPVPVDELLAVCEHQAPLQ